MFVRISERELHASNNFHLLELAKYTLVVPGSSLDCQARKEIGVWASLGGEKVITSTLVPRGSCAAAVSISSTSWQQR